MVTAAGETVALDLTMTDELRRAGLAREVVRLVQEARKSAGFEVTDRVAWVWSARRRNGGRHRGAPRHDLRRGPGASAPRVAPRAPTAGGSPRTGTSV